MEVDCLAARIFALRIVLRSKRMVKFCFWFATVIGMRNTSARIIRAICLNRFGSGWHEVEANYGDIVGLAEALGYLGDVTGGFVADLLGALEAEQLAFGVGGLYYSVGKEGEAIAVIELEGGLLIFNIGNDAEG